MLKRVVEQIERFEEGHLSRSAFLGATVLFTLGWISYAATGIDWLGVVHDCQIHPGLPNLKTARPSRTAIKRRAPTEADVPLARLVVKDASIGGVDAVAPAEGLNDGLLLCPRGTQS